MTKKSRTILFLICLILFLIITPIVIFYSQGYRFDFKTKKISQTGGFYFKVSPKSAEIYINDRFKKKTDFFLGEIQIENLLPKKYKIEIKKSGFHSWQKTLEVEEKKVTEAKNIVLFPENIHFDLWDKNIENFFISPDEKKIILKRNVQEKKWILELFDIEKNIKTQLIEEKNDLSDLEFSEDSKEIELKLKTNKGEKIFSLKIDNPPFILEERKTSFLAKEKKQLKGDDKNIFLIENNILSQFNPETNSFEKIFEPIKNAKLSGDKRKLAFFTDYEIWVLYLNEEISPFHKKGEKVFLLRFSEKIKDLFWLTDHYLMIQVGEKIKISEIDDRDRINVIDLASFNKNSKIFWSTVNRKLYVLTEKNLFVLAEKFIL